MRLSAFQCKIKFGRRLLVNGGERGGVPSEKGRQALDKLRLTRIEVD